MAKLALKQKQEQRVGTRTTEKKEDGFSRARTLLRSIGESTYDFDVCLAKLYEREEWKPKYETFEESCQPELGLGYRNALNHLQAGQTILKFGITKEQCAQLSWTNFVEISSLFKPDMKKTEIDSLMKKAGKMTHDEVQKFKKDVKHTMAGGTPQTRVKMTFVFLDEQAQVVQEALNMAKELMGLDHDDLALEYALVEWMGNHDPDKVHEIKSQLKGEVEEDEETEEEAEDEAEEEAEAPSKTKKKAAAKPAAKKASKKKAKDEDEDEGEDDEEAEDDDDLGI